MTEIIVGAFLIIVTAVFAEKVPPKWRKWLWISFVASVLLQAGLQIMRVRGERKEKESNEKAQQELKRELDQSLLNQQYTKGQLDSLSLTVGHLGQPSPVGTELAAAIKQMAQASAQNASDLKASNAELCKRAHAKADEIRVFQEKYDAAERAAEDEDWRQERLAKTDQERRDLMTKFTNRWQNGQQTHGEEFRNKYMADAKYLRDLLISRLPPATADTLRESNGQAEVGFTVSMIAGASNVYVFADYLDGLANAVCPRTNKEKQAIQATNHKMAAHLGELRSAGNRMDERCRPGSSNPPTATEVNAWISKANAYVRNSTLDEALKTSFEIEGLGWNSTHANFPPPCANLVGKIIYKNNQIMSLERSLASR